MNSMTGFASGEYETGETRLSIEIKGYNSRFLDLVITLPPTLQAFDGELRRLTAAACRRGKVEIAVRLREKRRFSIELNEAALDGYIGFLAKVKRRARERLGLAAEISALDLLRCEGVLESAVEKTEAGMWARFEPLVSRTLEAFVRERSREGAHTKTVILALLEGLEKAREAVVVLAPRVDELIKSNMKKRFEELGVETVDENRALAETAFLLMKWTIAEELCRLESHFAEFRAEASSSTASGKKLDFLCQEMGREINTIGAKTQLLEVSRLVVRMKEGCENIREQLRNVE